MTRAHGLTKYDSLVRERCNAPGAPLPQVFGRIGPRNPITGLAPDGSPFSAKNLLDAFGDALDGMRDSDDDTDGDVAAGMTFFGQFIDHDVTLDATSSIGRRIDPRTIRNVRTPALDLDCVYGDGPEATPHLYGNHDDETENFILYGTADNPLDLARNCKGTALIGDPRNDENVIVSQIQGLFITMHNLLMTAFTEDPALCAHALAGVRSRAVMEGLDPKAMAFEAARRTLRRHYHWIVLNDFLPSFVDADVLKKVIHTIRHGGLPKPWNDHSPVMPIEFSGAAFRFGHATVQSTYTLNDGQGKDQGLFDLPGFGPRDAKTDIEWIRMLDLPGQGKFDVARPIGRKLAAAIFDLPFVRGGLEIDGEQLGVAEAKKLPQRNVFRDRFALELPSGQQMARLMGVEELAAPPELRKKGVTKTPLWYYCLHEAEGCGGKLGPVGGGIVATTLVRLLALDPESVFWEPDFQPWTELGASAKGAYSLGHLAKFVEDNRGKVRHADRLRCPH